MNRFERLFFILEKNEVIMSAKNSEPNGIVKVTITEENMKLTAEISDLPSAYEYKYSLVTFFKNKFSSKRSNRIFDLKCDSNGSVKEEINILCNDNVLIGVVLMFVNTNNPENVRYPLVSFKVKTEEWKELLRNFSAENNNNIRDEINRKIEASAKVEADADNDRAEKKAAENKEEAVKAETKDKAEETKEGSKEHVNKNKLFAENFMVFDPFETTNDSYKWWRGADMHLINKMLIKADIRLPFELNKEGYVACEMFGHALLGIYRDKILEREFFILGIPAKSKNGGGNYYSNSRWEEIANESISGEIGYWLTYIDSNTSKVVKVI